MDPNIQARLTGLEKDLQDVRADLRSLAKRSADLLKTGKAKRDEGLIAKLRRQLGLS